MHYSYTALTLGALSGVLAKPLTANPSTPSQQMPNNAPGKFGLIAIHSTSPIHLQSINANEGKFWVGRQTASECPSSSLRCPSGNFTTFSAAAYDKPGRIAMDVVVPGGQSAYVAADGEWKFTTPHANSVTDGDNDSSFVVNKWTNHLEYAGQNSFSTDHDLLACPVQGAKEGIYQVYSNVQGLAQRVTCIEFAARLVPVDHGEGEFSAYQYV